jgi:prepilin-type N-terminal cleavage/methylation domain-containing protein
MILKSSAVVGSKREAKKAFTLIEMIGVLAVIAILAALLVPKVFNAINDARINGTAVSCETVKTATADHYGKYGKLNSLFGTNDLAAPVLNYDKTVLLAEGLLERSFNAKIAGGDPSTNAAVQLVTGASANGGTGFILDTTSTNSSVASAQYVVQAVIYNVAAQDAKDLNDRIDGPPMGATDLTSADTKGRVEYAAPSSGTVGAVYIYITHR